MRKTVLAILGAALASPAWAQSAIEAYNLSQTQLRGTARFMSMGGAFTALGGDLSTLGQNPAGIGVYRRSEIGVTLDISPSSFKTDGGVKYDPSLGLKNPQSKTTVACNNFGYIGAVRLDGPLRNFNWGVSYSRAASFDRVFDAYTPSTSTSLSNYIASYTTAAAYGNPGFTPDDLNFPESGSYNPYQAPEGYDWLSILAYTSSMIAPPQYSGGPYTGLYQPGRTVGDALTKVRERGYVDEYNIDFGGNVSDVVYWGLGFGITDLSYTREALYSESMSNAQVDVNGHLTDGAANFDLYNNQHITGSGWNMKLGVIVKPVNELRIGLAVHTPTWYDLSQSGYATTDYDYAEMDYTKPQPEVVGDPLSGSQHTDDSYYNFKLNAPWRFMVGVAGVIGSQAIISLDYERQAFGDMKVKYQNGWGEYLDDDYVNGDIKNYFKATDIIRVGAEYRVTPNFSVRAGYNYSTTNVKEEAADGATEIFTAGTNPAYTFNKEAYSISCGLGYRYRGFSIDAAYVYHNRKSTYHAFTNYDGLQAPQSSLSQTTNSIVLSLGYRF